MKTGLLVAGLHDGKLAVGYCAVHPKDLGKFDRELAYRIAVGRACSWQSRHAKKMVRRVPAQIEAELKPFLERCTKYFKTSLPEWTKNR